MGPVHISSANLLCKLIVSEDELPTVNNGIFPESDNIRSVVKRSDSEQNKQFLTVPWNNMVKYNSYIFYLV